MAALSADRQTKSKGVGDVFSYPVKASTTIYKGAMVMLIKSSTGAGYLEPATDATNRACVGVADEQVDNSSGADGALSCRVISGRHFAFAVSGALTAATNGQQISPADDQTVKPFNQGIGGMQTRFTSTSECWVFIPTASLGLHS